MEDTMHSVILRRLATEHIEELASPTGWTLPGAEGRH